MSYISLDARQSRSIITGTQDNGQFVFVAVTPDGHLPVEIKGPTFPFDSVHSEKKTILFQGDGVYGLNAGQLRSFTSGSGSTSNNTSLLTVNTGTTNGSRAEIESIPILRYRPGQGIVLLATVIFSPGVANSFQGIGLSNEENSLMVGYQNDQFGILYTKNGVREIQTLTITTASTTNENVTVTLGGVAFSVAVTNSASTIKTAYEISRGTYAGWDAEQVGSTVRFVAKTSGNKTGAFTLSGTTAVGAFVETKTGVSETSNFVAQQNFNGDKLDGTGAYGTIINPQRLNVFQLSLQYLGAGIIEVSYEVVSSTGQKDMVRVHTFDNPNQLTTPNFSNPAFNFEILTYSTGSTTNLSVSSASYQGSIEGDIFLQGNRMSYRRTITTVTAAAFQVLFSVRNNQVFNGRKSQAVINLLSIGASVKHTQPVEVLILKNPTLAGDPNFQSYSSISCTDWDTAATTATISDNSQIVWSGPVGETGNFLFSFTDNIRMYPGDVFSVVAIASTGTPHYVSANLNTREDI